MQRPPTARVASPWDGKVRIWGRQHGRERPAGMAGCRLLYGVRTRPFAPITHSNGWFFTCTQPPRVANTPWPWDPEVCIQPKLLKPAHTYISRAGSKPERCYRHTPIYRFRTAKATGFNSKAIGASGKTWVCTRCKGKALDSFTILGGKRGESYTNMHTLTHSHCTTLPGCNDNVPQWKRQGTQPLRSETTVRGGRAHGDEGRKEGIGRPMHSRSHASACAC